MVGLYETAIDTLCTCELNGGRVRPKIVASTATVRRAEDQLLALFAREEADIFPPPGPNRRDSFFATTSSLDVRPGRRYVGVAAQGRSLKVVLLWTYLALLAAAQRAWDDNGGAKNSANPADPYMTVNHWPTDAAPIWPRKDATSRAVRSSTTRTAGLARPIRSLILRTEVVWWWIAHQRIDLLLKKDIRQDSRGPFSL